MFRLLGILNTRYWPILLAAWILLLIGSKVAAPSWDSIAKDADVAFLSENSPSRQSDLLFEKAFPDQYAPTNVVLVLERPGEKLTAADEAFVAQKLAPRLKKLADDPKGSGRFILRVRTLADGTAGALLTSTDHQATIAIIDLSTAFLDPESSSVVDEIEKEVDQLVAKGMLPQGLKVSITGSATAGRDYEVAELKSVHAIEIWTIVAVIVLLLLLYRAPLVALIPLVTVYIAVEISLNLLALMGEAHILNLSRDVRIFVTVLSYGAGVDYCVFLIARYREELAGGMAKQEAMTHAIARVGGSITASAGTVIGGIGVLAFMDFGKVREAGIVIPFSLFIVLCSTLTFSSALLLLAGKWAFWPHRDPVQGEAKHVAPSLLRRLLGWDVWTRIGPLLLRRPALIMFATIALMVPCSVVALVHYQDESYNPIDDLPGDVPSVAGTRELEKHFPLGVQGTLSVFIQNERLDFNQRKGIQGIRELTQRIEEHRQELNVADVRSVAEPLGITSAADEAETRAQGSFGSTVMQTRAARYYVSRLPAWKGHLTRLDLVLTIDPFSSAALATLKKIEASLPRYLPKALEGSHVSLGGSTVSIRDLAEVKRNDLERVEVFVPVVIFVLLFIVLHRIAISLYLVLSVLLSYLTTLGVAYLLFSALYPGEFTGLDWKVPIFLFTILVAVGEDYNIFLMTRIKEEQAVHGPLQGIVVALARTGRVISSCGFIMAGTFASLLSGSLLAIKELGFALSFGILLDTLVVRPILVPTFLIILQSRLGGLGRYLALARNPPQEDASMVRPMGYGGNVSQIK